MNAWQGCVRPRAGKERLCISYNAVMSMYPGASLIYTFCCWVHFRYPCNSVCIYIERLRSYMPYYDVANLVTVTKTNMINEVSCCCGMLRTTNVRIPHQVSRRACAEVWGAYKVSCRSTQRSQPLRNLTILDGASWWHFHNCMCFQEHLRMLLQSLRAHCKAPGGPRSIWKYSAVLVRSTAVSERFACGFQTDFHFANVDT